MTDPAKPIIQIQNVSKRFGKVTAVDNVSLDINAGEFFVLLGPSGCGKTTLLRMIAGFELPTEGRILIDGQDMAGIPPNKRPVNMVFQSYAVFPHMSVADNVAYGLKIAGVKSGEIKDRVAEALELVKLGGFETRMPDQMSGGQKIVSSLGVGRSCHRSRQGRSHKPVTSCHSSVTRCPPGLELIIIRPQSVAISP